MFHLSISLVIFISLISATCHAMVCNATVNGVSYDLSPLSGIVSSVVPVVGAYNYYINVCGGVPNAGCSTKGSAFVCQVRKSPSDQFEAVSAYSDDAHTPAPLWSPSTSSAGGVLLTFSNGDACNLKPRYTLIDFVCDPTGQGQITVTESPQCTFNVYYPTKVVCPTGPTPPPTPSNCTQIIDKQLYDLSPLMGWDYHITSNAQYNYYLSICGEIQSSPCHEHDAVVCEVTKEQPETWSAGLAYVTETPTWGLSDGKYGGVKLTYTHGDCCRNDCSYPHSTVLDFRCDPNAINMTISMSNTGRCYYTFTILTNIACPQLPPPMSCKQTVDGVTYDLTSLQGSEVEIIPSTGLYAYYVAVCGVASACAKQGSAFACQVMKKTDEFVSILAYSDIAHAPAAEWAPSTSPTGGVTLTFTNGDICDYHERKTVIDFQCATSSNTSYSVIESPPCVFRIIYPTPVVCNRPPPIMPCSNTVGGVFYNLTPLSGFITSVVPSVGGYNYYLNICGAITEGNCNSRGGSAMACQVRKSPIDQLEAVLAYSDASHTPAPVWTQSTSSAGGVTLTFTNGDICNLRTRTTIFEFVCDPTGQGEITVTESPQCVFNVYYPTNIVCTKTPLFSSESDEDIESTW